MRDRLARSCDLSIRGSRNGGSVRTRHIPIVEVPAMSPEWYDSESVEYAWAGRLMIIVLAAIMTTSVALHICA